MFWIPFAAQMIGQMLQDIAAYKANRAMAQDWGQYEDDLRRNQDKMNQLWATQMRGNWDPGASMRGIEDTRRQQENMYLKGMSQPLSMSGSNPYMTDTTKGLADQMVLAEAGRRATVAALPETLKKRYIQSLLTQHGLDRISDFVRGNQNVLGYELTDAAGSANVMKGIGAQFKAIGGGLGQFPAFGGKSSIG